MGYMFEVVLTGSYFNQLVVNTFSYYNPVFSPGADPTAQALLDAMGWTRFDDPLNPDEYPTDSIADTFWRSVNAGYKFEGVFARDIYSDTNIAEYIFPPDAAGSSGVLAGEQMAPFLAAGFRTNRVNMNIKRGQKRLAGTTEPMWLDGGAAGPTAVGTYGALATAMSQVLPNGAFVAPNEFSPCVFKKERYEVEEDGVLTGRFAYAYFINPETQELNTAWPVTWTFVNTLRSQTSRQYGRGR